MLRTRLYKHVVVLPSSNVSRNHRTIRVGRVQPPCHLKQVTEMLAKWVLNVSIWMHLTWVHQFWHDSRDLAVRFYSSASIFFKF